MARFGFNRKNLSLRGRAVRKASKSSKIFVLPPYSEPTLWTIQHYSLLLTLKWAPWQPIFGVIWVEPSWTNEVECWVSQTQSSSTVFSKRLSIKYSTCILLTYHSLTGCNKTFLFREGYKKIKKIIEFSIQGCVGVTGGGQILLKKNKKHAFKIHLNIFFLM